MITHRKFVTNLTSVSLFALLCVLMTVPRVTAQDDTLTVTSRGVGISESDARKDALINAMQQAIGVYLDSETLIENNQIIRDEILAVSDGFVKAYDLIDNPIRRPDGLYEVTIKAEVQRGKVQERLETIRVIQGSVAGKDVAAEVLTKILNAESGKKLLEKHLDGLLEKLLVARLVGKDGKPSVQVHPIVDAQSDGSIKCTWNIEIYFDMKAFYEHVVPQLDKVFTAISEGQPGACVFKGRRVSNITLTEYPIFQQIRASGKSPHTDTEEEVFPIYLSIGRDQFGANERFRIYLLSTVFYDDVIEQIYERALTTQLYFYAMDENNGVVHEDVISLVNNSSTPTEPRSSDILSAISLGRELKPGKILSPRFSFVGLDSKKRKNRIYTDTLLISRSFMIERSDLEKISGVRFRFAK